jgi:CBS domain-containing protein
MVDLVQDIIVVRNRNIIQALLLAAVMLVSVYLSGLTFLVIVALLGELWFIYTIWDLYRALLQRITFSGDIYAIITDELSPFYGRLCMVVGWLPQAATPFNVKIGSNLTIWVSDVKLLEK